MKYTQHCSPDCVVVVGIHAAAAPPLHSAHKLGSGPSDGLLVSVVAVGILLAAVPALAVAVASGSLQHKRYMLLDLGFHFFAVVGHSEDMVLVTAPKQNQSRNYFAVEKQRGAHLEMASP